MRTTESVFVASKTHNEKIESDGPILFVLKQLDIEWLYLTTISMRTVSPVCISTGAENTTVPDCVPRFDVKLIS
jgi:hypothetical protein